MMFSPASLFDEASADSELLASQVADAHKNAGRLSIAINGFRAAQPQDEVSKLRNVLNKAVSSALDYEKECISLRKMLRIEREARRSEVEELTKHLRHVTSQAEIKENKFLATLEQQLASERAAKAMAIAELETKLANAHHELASLKRPDDDRVKRAVQFYNSEVRSLLISGLIG